MLALITQVTVADLISTHNDTLSCTELPLLAREVEGGELILEGHFARVNPHWKCISEGDAGLATFHGATGYISPNWYPSKYETGKVVPTWNYRRVEAYGTLMVHDDVDWLRDFVTRLTLHMERSQPRPWAVEDAPADFVSHQLRAIVGVEMRVRHLVGIDKLGQNRTEEDFTGAVTALSKGDPSQQELAREMAATKRERL